MASLAGMITTSGVKLKFDSGILALGARTCRGRSNIAVTPEQLSRSADCRFLLEGGM